jgi:hypothetical protein
VTTSPARRDADREDRRQRDRDERGLKEVAGGFKRVVGVHASADVRPPAWMIAA